MKSLYESIMQSRFPISKIEESIISKAGVGFEDKAREEIMSACGCTPESEIDVIDRKLYLKLRFNSYNERRVYAHALGRQNSYVTLKNILKTTDIYYVLTDGLTIYGSDISKGPDWMNDMNNILDLFEDKRWHFVDANHKEITGKFDVVYMEGGYFTDGTRDYKRLCDWLKKHSTKDIHLEIHGSSGNGSISASNISCDNMLIEYMYETCTLTNCKADTLKLGGGDFSGSPIGRCFFKNSKFNKIDVYSDDSTLFNKLYFMLSGIEYVETQMDLRHSIPETKLSLVKMYLKNYYNLVKKNLQAIGDPEVIINVKKRRGPGYSTFSLQEGKDKYILNIV